MWEPPYQFLLILSFYFLGLTLTIESNAPYISICQKMIILNSEQKYKNNL